MKYLILSASGSSPCEALTSLEKKVNELLNRKLPDGAHPIETYFDRLDKSLKYLQAKEQVSTPVWLYEIEPFTGWSPLGGHQLTYNSIGHWWCASQTMVNKEEQD